MATGRTVSKHARVYGSGYRLCGYIRQIGPLVWEYPPVDLTTMCDPVSGYLPGQPNITPTALNAVMDNTATIGLHVIGNAGNIACDMMIPIGIRTDPAQGDPVFCCKLQQVRYQVADDGGAVVANCDFPASSLADLPGYDVPWGVLLHADGAETGANSSAGVDGAAATSYGGYMMYQVFSSDGTATLSVQDSADNLNWLAVASMTTGVTDFTNPTAGIVEIGKTATIRRYTRWQLALGTANTVTFALALVRGRA